MSASQTNDPLKARQKLGYGQTLWGTEVVRVCAHLDRHILWVEESQAGIWAVQPLVFHCRDGRQLAWLTHRLGRDLLRWERLDPIPLGERMATFADRDQWEVKEEDGVLSVLHTQAWQVTSE